METGLRLLVLVPHRDARLPLRAWSASLFAAGLPGAWSFPWAAPLARLKRPLSAVELKSLARALRREVNSQKRPHTETHGKHGKHEVFKFLFSPCTLCPLCLYEMKGEKMSILGPSLSIKLSDDFFMPVAEAVDCRISPLVLGSALAQSPLPDGLPAPPQVSFRAAALANMDCRFLPLDGGEGGYLFEWEMGPLHWLPKFLGCTAD